MKNNIDIFRKELEDYTKDSISNGWFDEWKFKYLQERLRNEILSVRLYYCKNDNNKLKRTYVDLIKFLAHDPEDKMHIRRMIDITWDLDVTLSNLISDYLERFKQANHGIPSIIYMDSNQNDSVARTKWNDCLDKMIFAFKCSNLDKEELTDDDYKRKQEGLKLFVEYFDSLWI